MQKLIILGCMIFVASCATNTPLQNNTNCQCDIIFGHADDWDVISDDLARNIYRHNKICEEFYSL